MPKGRDVWGNDARKGEVYCADSLLGRVEKERESVF